MGTFVKIAGLLALAGVLYLTLWPVAIDPVPWDAPADTTGQAPYEINQRLDPLEHIDLGVHHAPEDVALDAQGRIYVATEDGSILRLQPDGSGPQVIANTGGRPLGLGVDAGGTLLVADAFRGLLQVDSRGTVTVLAKEADGVPILYANNLDIAADGKVYFSDASTRFGAKAAGSTMLASRLEIIEHRRSGRLLEYDPASGKTRTLMRGISFANGVAVAHDGSFVLVNETGEYRVLRYYLQGPRAGSHDVFIDRLPGFPDNLSRAPGGRYWLALISPRKPVADLAADKPFLRSLLMRLPVAWQPQATPSGHLIALDGQGRVAADLQRPGGDALYTGVTETADYLYLGSLTSPDLRRWKKTGALAAAGQPPAPSPAVDSGTSGAAAAR